MLDLPHDGQANEYGMPGYGAATYGDAFADVYDEWYESLDDADFVRFITTHLNTHFAQRTASVLELGVGTGRLLAQLISARTQHDVCVGVDSSAAMLAALTARNLPSRVSTICCDMSRDLPAGPFDLVFIGYNTIFNLPSEKALGACLSLVASRLQPDGYFMIDAVIPNDDDGDNVSVRSVTTDRVVLSVSTHARESQHISGQFIEFSQSEGVRLRPWVVTYWTPSQLDAIARASGLDLVDRYATGDGEPFTPESARHISRYRTSR